MFYYLLYNSSFSFVVENRLFSTILYGSILYILTHAVLNYCDISILNIVNNYYWTLFTLDIISFLYAFYQSLTDNNPRNDLNVSFNLLKNKINTIIDRKNDLTITQSTVLNKNNTNSNNSNNSNNNINNNNNNTNLKQQNVNTTPLQTSNKFSTPISQLQNINQGSSNQQGNQASTPISLIRNNVNIVEPFIDMQDEQFNQYAESNTGSDLGSLMDLADFENSL